MKKGKMLLSQFGTAWVIYIYDWVLLIYIKLSGYSAVHLCDSYLLKLSPSQEIAQAL